MRGLVAMVIMAAGAGALDARKIPHEGITPNNGGWGGVVRTFGDILSAPLYGFASGLFVRRFLGAVTHVEGPSMIPTLKEKGDYVMYERISVWLRRLRPGDVLICRSPQKNDQLLCKRLIAKEGDRRRWKGREITIPKGYIWVEGDNANDSIDSRAYGAISQSLVIGKVLLRILPLKRLGPLPPRPLATTLKPSRANPCGGHTSKSSKVDEGSSDANIFSA
ncbi:hypothetical protein AAMO2058_001689200 [Amorphochlora amoebiformis]